MKLGFFIFLTLPVILFGWEETWLWFLKVLAKEVVKRIVKSEESRIDLVVTYSSLDNLRLPAVRALPVLE